MGGIATKVTTDVRETLQFVRDLIRNLHDDTSGTIQQISQEIIETLQVIRQQGQRTTSLLTNAGLGLAAAFALGLLLYLTNFCPILRFIPWVLYALLCFHMLLTYFRHSRSETKLTIEKEHSELEKFILEQENYSRIDLSQRKLTDDDMSIVIQFAIRQRKCTELKLSNNSITSKGAKILSAILWNNQSLLTLSLWDNQLGDEGIRLICQSLSNQLCSLTSIDLSTNQLTDHAAKSLANMLKKNQRLLQLTLADNYFTDHGIQLITQVLRNQNQTLEILSLTKNRKITDRSVDAFIQMIETNQSLKTVYIDECDLSNEGKDKLMKKAKPKKGFWLHC